MWHCSVLHKLCAVLVQSVVGLEWVVVVVEQVAGVVMVAVVVGRVVADVLVAVVVKVSAWVHTLLLAG